MNDTVIEFDGYPAQIRTDAAPLDVRDTVYVIAQEDWGNYVEVGEWAEIMELVYDDKCEACTWDYHMSAPEHTCDVVIGYLIRYWGTDTTFQATSDRITHVQVHSCECGCYGPTSWEICHPDA